jgi:putative nucleotidyltransferase with HDIG domain
MTSRVQIFVSAICLLAIATFGAVGMSQPVVSGDALEAIVWLVALGLIADALGHEISRTTGGSAAFIPYLTAAAVAPVWPTVIGIAVSMLLQGLARGRAPIKTVFNVSQATLSLSLAILVYRALGGASDTKLAPSFVGLVVIFLMVNTLTVSSVISIAERRRLLDVWRTSTTSTVLYDLLALPFVYIFAQLYIQWGALGVFALAVPMLGARSLYKTNWQLQKTNQDLLQLMVAAIEARDPYTSGHSQRVARNSKIIARALGYPEREIERVGRAALLHDVGKIHEAFAPILRKTSRLTPEEQALMQTHATKSAELIQNVSYLRDIVEIVRHHHENWDGTGYPDGIAGEMIPRESRIIMVADTIDAMTTDRPYRAALTQDDVTAELKKLRGRQFDPQVCDVLLASPLYRTLFTHVGDPAVVDSSVVREGAPSLRLERSAALV